MTKGRRLPRTWNGSRDAAVKPTGCLDVDLYFEYVETMERTPIGSAARRDLNAVLEKRRPIVDKWLSTLFEGR